MKRLLGVALVVGALGFGAGLYAWQLASGKAAIDAGLAIVIAGNLLFSLWLWWRAKPGSGDAMVLPTIVLLMAAILLGILPRLFWPDAERLRLGASIASLTVVSVMFITQYRRRRSLRRADRPA